MFYQCTMLAHTLSLYCNDVLLVYLFGDSLLGTVPSPSEQRLLPWSRLRHGLQPHLELHTNWIFTILHLPPSPPPSPPHKTKGYIHCQEWYSSLQLSSQTWNIITLTESTYILSFVVALKMICLNSQMMVYLCHDVKQPNGCNAVVSVLLLAYILL